MQVRTNDFPGLTVYDDFTLNNPNMFGATIVAEIDPVQYWRDRPLFLGYKKPVLSDAINWTKNPQDYIDNDEAIEYFNAYKNIVTGLDSYSEQVAILEQQLKDYSHIQKSDPDEVIYPDAAEDNQTINILDSDGNIIRTITTDINARAQKTTPTGTKGITILDNIPENYNDDLNPDIHEASIISLSDSFIKEKLWISHEYMPNISNEISDASGLFTSPIDDMNTLLQPEDIPDPIPVIDILSKDIDIWYGIPLINLSPREIPVKDSIILHIDTQKDFTLNITNVVGTGLDGLEIRIDKTIPPGTRFMAGVYISNNNLSIYLKIDGDDTLYEKSILLFEVPPFNLTSFGTDNEGLKSLCGYIWDIRYLEQPFNYNNNPSTPIPYVSPGGFTYDMNSGRIQGDALYPIGIGLKPSYNSGDWIFLDDQWRAVYNGYLDRFFCRTNLQNTSFSLTWYQYQFGYPDGIKTLLSDNIHSNYIRYDYDNFNLIVDFNGTHFEQIISLPEFIWIQFNIRYNLEDNQLIISLRDFFWERTETIYIDINPNLDFELISLWGRFDEDLGRYIEIQNGLFTLLSIHDRYQTENELDKMFQNHKSFLIGANISELPETLV